MNKATAYAHPNIALVKYWGKRDEHLMLPHQSSLSLTMGPWRVTTTVEFGAVSDSVEINGEKAEGASRARVLRVLDAFRRGRELGPAKVVSRGDFPVAAGLASSAAAFAALAMATRAAAGLPHDAREASLLARLGSGSACRSIQGGVCVWQKGERQDGHDSYAIQKFPASHWPQLKLLVAVVSRNEKEVSSRDGMRHTVETSPFYPAWTVQAEKDVVEALELIKARDLSTLGPLIERNALQMHATALGASPPLWYFLPETLRIFELLRHARREGLSAWATLDAGPNPIIVCEQKDEANVAALLQKSSVEGILHGHVADDAQLISEHLF